MDFVTLATETDPRQMMRYLIDVLGDDDGLLVTASSDQGGSNINETTVDVTDPSSKPLLSQAAEAELYLLATNFLLYVAMVIIATIVAKIYFPESLQRSEPSVQRSRSYSYRMAEIAKEEEMEYYGSDAEDDGDIEDESEVLDSDDEEETKALRRAPARKRTSFFLEEFNQESLSRVQVLRRLLFCSLMLNLTFITWGAIQVSPVDRLVLYPFREVLNLNGFSTTGAYANAKVPSKIREWGVFYLLLRFSVYKSILDTYNVNHAPRLHETTPQSDNSDLRVFLSKYFKHVEQLVSVRSTTIRFISCNHAVQVVQTGSGNVDGKAVG